MYKINLHAHTIFSDGANSPLGMALAAEKLDFSCLVITDHYYGPNRLTEHALNKEKYRLLRRACSEARSILPVIIGMELAIGQEEILIFSTPLIKEILEADTKLSIGELLVLKEKIYSACILCHPGSPHHWPALLPVIDGYEKYNSGQNWFKDRTAGCLSSLPHWCNSDAHSANEMAEGYNLTKEKITTETDLIQYIKKGIQSETLMS